MIWTSIHPGARHAEQVALLWPHGGRPVAMIESEIPIPADRWEFRTSGLWVEQVCERPHDHWSYGLESFALELDHPTELIRTGHGIRVPMGWELDFDAAEPSRWLLTGAEPLEVAGAYTQRGELHGILLGADGETEFEGTSHRWHWWGTKPLTSVGLGGRDEGKPSGRLHLPLSQGPVIVTAATNALLLTSAATLGSNDFV